MRYLLSATALVAIALTFGCGPKPPTVSPEQFSTALIDLETKTAGIIEAFATDQPRAADAIVHGIFDTYRQVERGATTLLPGDQLASVAVALRKHLEAIEVLHGPMHKKDFPEDFNFEPVRVELTESLKEIRAAVSEAIAAEMQQAEEKRTSAAAAKAGPAEDGPSAASPDDTSPDVKAADGDSTTDAAALPPPITPGIATNRAPLCPTVMLYDRESNEAAPERINRVAQWMAAAPPDARWVQLVPTLHARVDREGRIEAYGQMLNRKSSWESPDNFTEATDALADRFRDVFAAAIRQAVRRGLHVAILPHLDPAMQTDNSVEWRNHYRFRPAKPIGIGSYESLLLDPLVEAINAEATSATRIDLAISGEMGRSLFEHPGDYLKLVRRLRQRFASNPTTAGVRLGVALNWSGLAGEADRSKIDRRAVGALFDELDFIGYSCYAPVSVPPVAGDFARATENFLEELQGLGGVTENAKLMISEVGIGGGHPIAANGGNSHNDNSDKNVEQVAAKPYEGSGSPKVSPWKKAELAKLRTEFHTALLDYLSNEKTNRIEKAFLWSEGPWDPQGVADLRFRDESIATAIADHNDKASL